MPEKESRLWELTPEEAEAIRRRELARRRQVNGSDGGRPDGRGTEPPSARAEGPGARSEAERKAGLRTTRLQTDERADEIEERTADKVRQLPKPQLKDAAIRTAKEFKDDNLTDRAAALTYYGLLSLFPALLVLVALLGVLGQYPQTFNALIDILRPVMSGQALDTISGNLQRIIQDKGGAGALLGVSLLGALWSASNYLGAFMRAANEVWEVQEGRPFWKLRPLQIAMTVVGLALLTLVLVAVVLSGPIAEQVGDQVGLGSTAVTVWQYAKWPVIVLIVMLLVAAVFYLAPNVKPPSFKWITPGGALAILVWIVASVGFAFYVANFGSYNATYGALAGLVVLLLWMWLSNLALLFGLEFDSELERSRELAAGLPAEERIQLPYRDPPKQVDSTQPARRGAG
jgi:membrane protein